ncbi:MAG: AMP-binding protein, partial [Acidimicrobiia bacterium]|nr:AMP-binding protein [Acidimicrobiia bacterium]
MTDVFRTELTPLAFLERAADAFSDKTAVVYGDRRVTYRQMGIEVTKVANALRAAGIERGDRVAYLMPNLPEMLYAHFAVPMLGAVLVAINTRLSGPEIARILDHSGSRVLVADTELLEALATVSNGLAGVELIVALDDIGRATSVESVHYDEFIASGVDDPPEWSVDDEERTISINYTSGTTGEPKGVMYTHRGAYLNSLGELVHSRHDTETVYLWTLPMFHCNGWCTTWAVTAIGGTHVCLRSIDNAEIWRLIDVEGVTHLNGAPTVLVGMANAPQAKPLSKPLTVTTAGAPPSPTIIGTMERLGARMIHVYGLTETYGPHTVCERQPALDSMGSSERVRFLARQGVSFVIADPIRVVDDLMNDVPRDGQTMGEVVMRGNNVMKGYFSDPQTTETAFRGGWFHSGDIAVWHADGYIELRDRAKDIIISGGENISTIEVEQALVSHPEVLECAVVAVPHEKWGERPKAYVVLKPGATVTERELIDHVRSA